MVMLYIHSIGNQLQNTMVVFKMRGSVPSARYFFTSRGVHVNGTITSCGAHVNCTIMAMLYTHSIGNQP